MADHLAAPSPLEEHRKLSVLAGDWNGEETVFDMKIQFSSDVHGPNEVLSGVYRRAPSNPLSLRSLRKYSKSCPS